MDANEIDQLAEAMLRKQAEAQAKREAELEAQAAVAAKAAEVQAKRDKAAADKEAAAQAEQEREAEEERLLIEDVLSASVGDVFVDRSGAEHRVVGTVHEGIDTVSRDRDGGTVGNWRRGRDGVEAVAAWKKK